MRLLSRAAGALCLVLALAMSASAQMRLGVKAGYSRPSYGGSDAANAGTEAMNTFSGGVFLTVPVAPFLALQPEVLYAPKGAQMTVGTLTGKNKVDYLEVPVLLKLMVPVPALHPSVFAGPYVGYKIRCNVEAAGVSASCGDADTFKSTDFGATFGAGIEMPLLPKINALLDARYDLGFSKIEDATNPSNATNRSLNISVGLSIPLGVK